MKRRVEFLVRKRGGHEEWLRATKLARSVERALSAAGEHRPGRSVELASCALDIVRCRAGDAAPILSAELSGAVERVLIDGGHAEAAGHYAATRAERRRRELWLCRPAGIVGDRRALLGVGRSGRPPDAPPYGAAPERFTS